jgi:hypothetical protein
MTAIQTKIGARSPVRSEAIRLRAVLSASVALAVVMEVSILVLVVNL